MTKKLIYTLFICFSMFNILQADQTKIKPKKSFDDIIFNWSGTFAEALQTTGDKHYKISDPQACMVKAINSFLNSLDPHSSFLDPKTYKSIIEATTGEFYGIGIVIDNTRSTKDKFLTVINTIPDGPADKAGIKPHDKIIEIEGNKLEGMPTEEAIAKLKGERNTTVNIKVIREKSKQPVSFGVTRDIIKEQSSLAFYIPKYNIYYVYLSTFSNNSVKQIKNILEKSKTKKYEGIVLDLRNNSGGLLNAVIDIASLFLDKGSLVVVTKDKNDKKIAEYKTTQTPIADVDIPIFILVNNYTASASEILAGCLKIHSQNLAKKHKNTQQKRLMVFIIGTKTFGKGSVQEIIPVSNNCAIKLTTSLYFLPDYTTIQGKGIEPDFVIERLFPPPEKVVWFMERYGREEALQHSIKPNGNKEADIKKKDTKKKSDKTKEKPKSWTERIEKNLKKDNQFLDAIRLMNILKISDPAKVNNREDATKYLKDIFGLDGKLKIQKVEA